MKLIFGLLIVGIVLMGGCIGQEESEVMKQECIQACQEALQEGRDLSAGPCLLNPMSNKDWVCDVAHDPRQPLDNIPDNQCSAYRQRLASHFIEVDTECNFIESF